MRFMTLVKSSESATPPPPALFAAIDQLGRDATEAGVMRDTGGLAPIARAKRVQLTDGEIHITDGPFTEAKELVGGYAIYDVASEAEAVEWARRFIEIHKEFWPQWSGEVEVRQIFGPEDVG